MVLAEADTATEGLPRMFPVMAYNPELGSYLTSCVVAASMPPSFCQVAPESKEYPAPKSPPTTTLLSDSDAAVAMAMAIPRVSPTSVNVKVLPPSFDSITPTDSPFDAGTYMSAGGENTREGLILDIMKIGSDTREERTAGCR